MTGNLLIRNVRPRGAPATDLLIHDGRIARIGPDLPIGGMTVIDPKRQSARLAVLVLGHGSTAIRSHVDIDTDVGLRGFEGAAAREEYRDAADIEIVAFPQSGLMCRSGTLELMEAALAGGAGVVGGLDPCAIDRDPKGRLDAVFALATAVTMDPERKVVDDAAIAVGKDRIVAVGPDAEMEFRPGEIGRMGTRYNTRLTQWRRGSAARPGR